MWGRMKRGEGGGEEKKGRKFRANKKVKGPFRENAERNLFSPSDLEKFLSYMLANLFHLSRRLLTPSVSTSQAMPQALRLIFKLEAQALENLSHSSFKLVKLCKLGPFLVPCLDHQSINLLLIDPLIVFQDHDDVKAIKSQVQGRAGVCVCVCVRIYQRFKLKLVSTIKATD